MRSENCECIPKFETRNNQERVNRAQETVQSLKCLPHKYEDLSSVPGGSCKKKTMHETLALGDEDCGSLRPPGLLA